MMPNRPIKTLEDRVTHVLSECLNDNAPLGEEKYRWVAKAVLKELSVAQPQVEPTADERDDPSPQRRAGPWPTAIEPKTRKIDLQVEPLHMEDWIRREPERAQPQVELLEIIRTARAYIGILEAHEKDEIAKKFLGSLYNKMTEAIKPILP
jgi:hypothetical protein